MKLFTEPIITHKIYLTFNLEKVVEATCKLIVELFDYVVDFILYYIQKDRLWHKTRNTQVDPKGHCVGTDADRNFGYKWNGKSF